MGKVVQFEVNDKPKGLIGSFKRLQIQLGTCVHLSV